MVQGCASSQSRSNLQRLGEGTQTPERQVLERQSRGSLQALPSSQGAHILPPQSTSLSSPLRIASSQAAGFELIPVLSITTEFDSLPEESSPVGSPVKPVAEAEVVADPVVSPSFAAPPLLEVSPGIVVSPVVDPAAGPAVDPATHVPSTHTKPGSQAPPVAQTQFRAAGLHLDSPPELKSSSGDTQDPRPNTARLDTKNRRSFDLSKRKGNLRSTAMHYRPKSTPLSSSKPGWSKKIRGKTA